MSWAILYSVIGVLFIFVIGFPVLIIITREYFRRKKLRNNFNKEGLTIGFFHPYCNAGGGVERVLWCAIRAIQNKYPHIKVILYTGDLNASPEEITKKVVQRFDVKLPQPVDFVYLYGRRWIEAETYPYFTLIGQSIGSLILGIEAMMAFLPDVYVDSMGYAFTLPLFSFFGLCSVVCYIHHPTITTDMLSRFSVDSVNHVNRSPILSTAKLIYYRLFARAYARAGRFSDSVIVNSTWTEDHINSLWDCLLCSHRVYPPCDTESIKKIVRENNECNPKEIRIVSIGQFRAEKDHPLQFKTMYQLRQIVSEDVWDSIKLVIIGTCSSKEDEIRVKDMQDLCKHLSLENNVEFHINISYSDLVQELVKGLIGLHTMQNEHFGISVVECMAAGLIMVAHRSGGPKLDIIEEAEGSRTGYFATDETEFASTIASIIQMPKKTKEKIQEAARSSVDRFSVQEFESGFLRAVEPFLNTTKTKTEN